MVDSCCVPPREDNSTFHSSNNTFLMGKCGADELQNLVTIPNRVMVTSSPSSPCGCPNSSQKPNLCACRSGEISGYTNDAHHHHHPCVGVTVTKKRNISLYTERLGK